MLMLLLPLSSMLLLPTITPYFWPLSVVLLVVMSCASMILLMPVYSYSCVSAISAMDTTSATLICLTTWITAMMMLASYKILHKNNLASPFMVTTVVLLIILTLCFSSSNLFHFYIWFEASLIPTMLLIMVWGYQPERVQASMYLMVYTVVASLPLLLLICKIYTSSHHLLMPYPWLVFPGAINPVISWFIMMAAFMVKLPLFSVHLWLPKAHVEAPVAGSMILAAILLKLGGYGLMRVILLFPAKNLTLYAPITSVALIGAVITSLICLRQSDLKSLIAYSSVGHMGLMIAGMLSNSSMGLYGSLAMMIAHGLVSSALFCMANMTYEMTHTRSIALTKGLLTCLPMMSLWWFMFICANMAAPPSINLMSEILLITATMSHMALLAIPLGVISFLTAAYSLYLFSAVNHGSPLMLTNPLPVLSPHYVLMIIMHLVPVFMLILSPDAITNWF